MLVRFSYLRGLKSNLFNKSAKKNFVGSFEGKVSKHLLSFSEWARLTERTLSKQYDSGGFARLAYVSKLWYLMNWGLML